MPEPPQLDPSVGVFDDDIVESDGYLYTDDRRLSTKMATTRLKELILQSTRFAGRSVLDIGCGDGFFTVYYWDQAKPESMVGIDAASQAVAAAAHRAGDRAIRFETANMHELPYADRQFDVALLQGVLHHDDYPHRAIREALRVCNELVILEPNGNNLGLKLLEKVSPYHRRHKERSYRPLRLRSWIEGAGGTIKQERFGGFVPMFCPDSAARAMKAVEPLVEGTPLRRLMASVVVITATH